MHRFVRSSLPALVATVVVALGGFAVAAERPALIGGSDDAGDEAVVLLRAPSSNGDYFCTGVVVGPHTILTTASCLFLVPGATTLEVFTGATWSANAPASQTVAVAERHADPAWDQTDPRKGNDVGVVLTRDALTIAPARLAALPSTAAGTTGRLVGYGVTVATDQQGTTGESRRQGAVSVADSDAAMVHVVDGSVASCQGDGGGPLFLSVDGVERVVALQSFAIMGCSPSMGSWASRVDAAASFLAPYLAADGVPADLGATSPPTAVPQPHGGCAMAAAPGGAGGSTLILAALLVGARGRRRQRAAAATPTSWL